MLALKNEMVKFYNEHSFTHEYMFGFNYDGVIYTVKATSKELCQVLKLDRASRGNGYALRFKPTKAIKTYLISLGATPLCSTKMFSELVNNSKYNKGEIYEKLETEKAGQTWIKDSVPFTDDGDLTVNGIAYQLKFEGATFINEKQIERMRARA